VSFSEDFICEDDDVEGCDAAGEGLGSRITVGLASEEATELGDAMRELANGRRGVGDLHGAISASAQVEVECPPLIVLDEVSTRTIGLGATDASEVQHAPGHHHVQGQAVLDAVAS